MYVACTANMYMKTSDSHICPQNCLPTIGTQIRDTEIDLLCRSYSSVRTSDAAVRLGMDEDGTVARLFLFCHIVLRLHKSTHRLPEAWMDI